MTPDEHLKLHLGRVVVMVQQAMRRHAERFMAPDGDSYSDDCVSGVELRCIIGQGDAFAAQALLDTMGVPRPEALDEASAELNAMIQHALHALARVAGPLPFLPIEEIRTNFGLSDLEVDLLLAAAGPRLSISLSRLYSVALADFSVRQPTAGFLAELVAQEQTQENEALSHLESDGALMRHRLLERHQHARWAPNTPLLHAPISVPERVLNFLLGRRRVSGHRLHEGVRLLAPQQAPEHMEAHRESTLRLRRSLQTRARRIVLVGPRGVGRCSALRAILSETETPVLALDLSVLLDPRRHPHDEQACDALIEGLREARLCGAVVLLRQSEPLPSGSAIAPRLAMLRALIKADPGKVLATVEAGDDRWRQWMPDATEVVFELPDQASQRRLWSKLLSGWVEPSAANQLATTLAHSYSLTPRSIHRSVKSFQAIGHSTKGHTDGDVLLGVVHQQMNHSFGALAQPHSVATRLGDIVLSGRQAEQVQEFLNHARFAHKVFEQWGFAKLNTAGTGLSALFSGPPGTGKTLLAGVLAAELGRVMYRVDLSQIVDKYIGETEKNLARVFDEAQRAQAVLLFDEADSLFAKRTSVKSSNDRYANLEVNFLLQRIEHFSGISILTTNHATSIDEAFQRRIRFKIAFDVPDDAMRARLWRKLIPSAAPVSDDIDFEGLGRAFELTGGHIRNALIRAAMLAAAQGRLLDHELLFEAGSAESREIGTLVREERGEQW